MIDNNGNEWRECEYEGYGVFAGRDFYELLAEMNGKEGREEGIRLAFGNAPYLSPNLWEEGGKKWVNRAPETCPNQGFFYCDDEYEG
jgi:hypothetical protein